MWEPRWWNQQQMRKFVQLAAAAAGAPSFGGFSNQFDWMRELVDCEFAVLEGTLAFLSVVVAVIKRCHGSRLRAAGGLLVR